MERLDIVRRLDDELGGKLTERVEALADELQARDAARGIKPVDTDALLERLAAVAGPALASEVEEAINAIAGLYTDAGFALGYHTRENPGWLIFRDGDG